MTDLSIFERLIAFAFRPTEDDAIKNVLEANRTCVYESIYLPRRTLKRHGRPLCKSGVFQREASYAALYLDTDGSYWNKTKRGKKQHTDPMMIAHVIKQKHPDMLWLTPNHVRVAIEMRLNGCA